MDTFINEVISARCKDYDPLLIDCYQEPYKTFYHLQITVTSSACHNNKSPVSLLEKQGFISSNHDTPHGYSCFKSTTNMY